MIQLASLACRQFGLKGHSLTFCGQHRRTVSRPHKARIARVEQTSSGTTLLHKDPNEHLVCPRHVVSPPLIPLSLSSLCPVAMLAVRLQPIIRRLLEGF